MIDIRATTNDELTAAARTLVRSLLGGFSEEAWQQSRPSWEEMPSLSAWDGDVCVGHAGRFVVDTVVPGGVRVPTGAVSRVGVATTHRRQGIATRLMEQLIADSVSAGEVLMSLRASETPIYGRFGFGMAGEAANLEIDARGARPLTGPSSDGSYRVLDVDDALDAAPDVYEELLGGRDGMITRPSATWWRREFRSGLLGKAAATVVIHEDASGVPDGLLHYETAWNDDQPDEAPTGRGDVRLLLGSTPAGELALWRYLLDIDLVSTWRANTRPLDDLIRRAAADTRAVRVRAVEDEQWIRIIDVQAALQARAFGPLAAPVRVAVSDELVPANAATWEIAATGVSRSGEPADIACDIATLSAAYLGGTSWSALGDLGRVRADDPAALSALDAAFAVPRLPWCGTFF